MKQLAHLAPILLSWLSLSAVHAGQLNDTGQTTCYDASATPTGTVSSSTPAPESAGFEGQDCSLGAAAADAVGVQVKLGGSSVKGRDYTKLDNSGAPLSDSVMTVGREPGQWSCTRDNVTGLVWLLRLNDAGFGDRDHRYAFGGNTNSEGDTCEGQFGQGNQCTTAPVVQAANLFGFCGGQDWAIPTPAQLESLFAYENPGDPANLIDREYFPDQVNDGVNPLYFWSQTEQEQGSPPSLWIADFSFGWVSGFPANAAAYLRLVRAPTPAASPRFSVAEPGPSGERVVVDAVTGLMWKQCPQGLSGAECTGSQAALTWSQALTAAGGESFAGFADWRLPNINELASIRDYSPVGSTDVAVGAEFKGTGSIEAYWSSTNDPRVTSLETALSYQYSGATAHLATFKNGGTAAVRLVRAGSFLAAHAPGTDTQPGAFTLPAKNAGPGSLIESDSITITAMDGVASVSVFGAAQSAVSVNGGAWTSLATAVRVNDQLRVRHLSPSSIGATASTTLNVGGTIGTFTSTTVASPPGKPTGVTATAGNASATVTFVEPASNGGSVITGYMAVSIPAGGASNCAAPPSTTCSVTGLSNGTPYTFTVAAINAAGTGSPSDPSNAVTPATVPGAPTNVTAAPGDGRATVSFTAPTSNGGSAILDYTATSSPGSIAGTCSMSPCSVTGLSNATTYSFTVRARNAVGAGAASAVSNSVRPGAPPTISITSSPLRTTFPLNHNSRFLFLPGADHLLVVTDPDGDVGALTVTAATDNPGLFGASGATTFKNPFIPGLWGGSLQPLRDLSGSAQVTYTVTDSDGISAQATVNVTIEPGNRTPIATYTATTTELDYFFGPFPSIDLPDDGQAVTYQIPAFATLSPGLGEETAQTLSVRSRLESAALSSVQLAPNGTLNFTLNPQNFRGYASFVVWPVDDGIGDSSKCPANQDWWGRTVSESIGYRINLEAKSPRSGPCGSPRLVVITGQTNSTSYAGISTVEARAIRQSVTSAKGNTALTYLVVVSNLGRVPLQGVRVATRQTGAFAAPRWTCTGTSPNCSPMSGTGPVNTVVNIPVGETLVIELTGDVTEKTAFVEVAASIAYPQGVDGEVVPWGNLLIDALSNEFIHYGGFE